jgi:hypothetical protein
VAAATSSSDAAYALSQAYRSQQTRQSASIALIVALYYQRLVDVEDPAAVGRWLDIMIPRILTGSRSTAFLASQYVTALRQLELPSEPRVAFAPSIGSVEAQIRTSLAVVGPSDFMNKMREIRTAEVPEITKQALIEDAKKVTAEKVAGVTMRHVQSGGRKTILDSTRGTALGYVRVTSAKPCFFCAMLASRGLVFAEDSFDLSDPRFTGDGTAKVHDNCSCSMKPVYVRRGDKALEATKVYTDLWEHWGAGGGGKDAVLRFRRGYDHWQETGEVLSFDTVSDLSAFRARNAA